MNYFSTQTNLLDKTHTITKIIQSEGIPLIVAAMIGAFVYATQDEEIVSDIEL